VKLYLVLSILLFALSVHAAVPEKHFEPLNDVLARYNVTKIPDAQDYPDVPAIGLLSLDEYKQGAGTHERKIHKIVKILTSAGKDYATVVIPCYSNCFIEARTIKADGQIINLPSRDLMRSDQRTKYSQTFTLFQFALPSVEPGDIIEYRASVTYPAPFYAEDFRFGERYPVIREIFSLSYPDSYSYSYISVQPPGSKPFQISRDSFIENGTKMLRSTFSAESIAAMPLNNAYYVQPGLRIFVDGINGVSTKAFRDWSGFAEFVSQHFRVGSLIGTPVKPFINTVIGKETDPAAIVHRLYDATDNEIEITGDQSWMSGFSFQSPEETFRRKMAGPEDFALFLAACYKELKFDVDLILVNSYDKPEATKESPFPPDLDQVFLNVKTKSGEFLIDCNGNGRSINLIPSEAMNRFALGIPVSFDHQVVTAPPFLSAMPYREGNRSHIDVTMIPGEKDWKLNFTWYLSGDFESSMVSILRSKNEEAMKYEIENLLRTHIRADLSRDIQIRNTSAGLEVSGIASVPRKKINQDLEIVQNEFWNNDFQLRPYEIERRDTPVLLPVAGEISASYTIQMTSGASPSLPISRDIECNPVHYSLSIVSNKGQVRIDEKLKIRDVQVKPANFPKFREFLDSYYSHHFWSIVMSSHLNAAQVKASE